MLHHVLHAAAVTAPGKQQRSKPHLIAIHRDALHVQLTHTSKANGASRSLFSRVALKHAV